MFEEVLDRVWYTEPIDKILYMNLKQNKIKIKF